MTALAVVVRWRASAEARRPTVGSAATLLGTADERDKATTITASLAWVGLAAFLANVIGLAAVALGADGFLVIGAVEAVLIAVLRRGVRPAVART